MQKNPNDIIVFLLVTTVIILVMAFFVLTILFFYRKRQISYKKELKNMRADYERSLLKTQLEIQEQTFQNISREIHDNISLSLTLAKLKMNTLNLYSKESSTEQINSSIEFVSKAISDLSDISRSLNSEVISDHGLIKALELETAKFKRLGCYTVTMDVSGNPVYMEAQKELVIFRIVQESLNNILKHAKANTIQLNLNFSNAFLSLIIADNGIGFDHANISKGTAGFKNMKKRAELINSELEVSSVAQSGTKIKILIPL